MTERQVEPEPAQGARHTGPLPWAHDAAARLLGLRRWLRYDLLSQTLILLAIIVWVHWGLLTDPNGCVNWGNYELPCTTTQYVAWSPPLLTWQPFSFLGASLPLPFTTVADQGTIWAPITGLSLAFGPATGAKLFAVLSTLFLGVTFLLFSGAYVAGYWGRLAAAALLLAGPFQLGLYGSGDYSQFVAQGFVFLSIFLLSRAVDRADERWAWFPLSFLALVLSVSIIQMFELGLVLYLFSFAVFLLVRARRSPARLRSVLPLAARLLLLPAVLAPLLLPAILAPAISLGPSSAYALPLNTFRSSSATPLAVFLGDGYLWGTGSAITNNIGFAMVSSTSGTGVALAWSGLTVALVLGLWAGIVLLGNGKGYALLALAIAGSLVGAGSRGPLAGFNTYLYLHLYGYQELYASYIWDWVVVVPATAAALGILIDRLVARGAARLGIRSHPRSPSATAARGSFGRWLYRARRIGRAPRRTAVALLGVVVTVLLVASTLLPFALGDQYGPVKGQGNVSVGMQTVAYPRSYSEIPGMLERLVGSNYSGVAVFNPDPGWFLDNSTWVTPNYFLYYPTVRTPSLPGFALPPYPVNYYTYWVYSEFYSNATPYLGPLLALEGIQYVLVFYQTHSGTNFPLANGVNASELLHYQSGIVPVYSNADFAVYQNRAYSGVVASLANLSLVAGDYSTLGALAAQGVTLTDQGMVFPTDIPTGGCARYVDRASQVYAASPNALYGLALECTEVAESDPVSFVGPGADIFDGWASTYASDGGALGRNITDAWPTPLAASLGEGHSIRIPIDVTACASPCHLWLPVRVGAQAHGGSTLRFDWGADRWTLNTSVAWGGTNNSMAWVELPFNLTTGRTTLEITSGPGYNAVGELFAASDARLSSWLTALESQKPVLLVGPGQPAIPGSANVVPSGGWTISSDTSGYQVTGGPSPLLLVRVPYAPNLEVGAKGSTLEPALGAVATLVWNPDNASSLRIAPTSGTYLGLGSLVLALTLVIWGVGEFLWIRARRRRLPPSSGEERPSSGHEPISDPSVAGSTVSTGPPDRPPGAGRDADPGSSAPEAQGSETPTDGTHG